ncbi:MAG: zinc-binding alcohol dehydrogenase family protein [Bacteroidetes bacterium]|jgi:L-galactonate 5-dehydrogenase|nr:zinc-binding alcohol dehydrogenase family protein [Bacteroidota bacterium]MBT4398143.1 zinc-binding alcohol dehydrogenase family protein [Bacteroidota bacterium]MBT4412346.1 zinc-binding alcohol dehydrogenase family protein [Bacteroidota bacterium]MBT5425811.1 zinc-binding alcohol dehydrogenase family protein [Bacteroidota bacterium]MBT7092690.1 zinc-binding alcohol dehydrogenase family protein [Bacteroidota bacterium]
MLAVQITKPGSVKITEISQAPINSDELILKVRYIGLCGSDLSSFLGKNPMVKYPVIPGHEIAAEIVECGSEVPEHISIGQHVTVNPYTNCGTCPSCKNDRVNACQYNQTLGVQRDGALSEYITVKWQKVLIENDLTDIELALTEPLSVGFHAVDRGRITDNDIVLVLGCGMIGAGAIVRSALRGAIVIAADIDDNKLEMASLLGAHYTINSQKSDLHTELSKLSKEQGPDVVIEAAGNPITYLAAINEVAFSGRVVCIGYAKQDISFTSSKFVQKEMDIMGSRNALPKDIQVVINYLKRKTCPTEKLVTQIITPEETGQALKYWSENPGKISKILVKL